MPTYMDVMYNVVVIFCTQSVWTLKSGQENSEKILKSSEGMIGGSKTSEM